MAGIKQQIAAYVAKKLPKASERLKEQVVDFAIAEGGPLPTEETLGALRALRNAKPDSDIVKSVTEKMEGGLSRGPGTLERLYAIGSSTSKKTKPSDVDLIAQHKVGTSDLDRLKQNVRMLGDPTERGAEKAHIAHASTKRPQEDVQFYDALYNASKAVKLAREGAKRYGKDYHWERLVGIAGALGLSGLAAPDKSEAGVRHAAQFLKKTVGSKAWNLIKKDVHPELRTAKKNLDKYFELGDDFAKWMDTPADEATAHDIRRARRLLEKKYAPQFDKGSKILAQMDRDIGRGWPEATAIERAREQFHAGGFGEAEMHARERILSKLGLPDPSTPRGSEIDMRLGDELIKPETDRISRMKGLALATAAGLAASAESEAEAGTGTVARKLAKLTKDSYAMVAGAKKLREGDKTAYHWTWVDPKRIEKEGLRPLSARMTPDEVKQYHKDLDNIQPRDYTHYTYSSLDPEPEFYAPGFGGGAKDVGKLGARYEIDLTHPKVRAKSVLDPKMEGGLVMTRGGVPKSALKRVFGMAGAMGGGGMGILDLLGPSEAEAMPRGVYQGITKAALSGEVSSAAKVLVGKVLDGKTIKDVRKGTGNWRGILFDDDTMMTVTNTELNDLSRAYGTKKYTGQFQTLGETPSKTEQALKSLEYHQARVKPFTTKGTVELYHRRHVERLKEMGMGETPGGSLVNYKGKFFTMPTEYARHLQDLGLLKIEKEVK